MAAGTFVESALHAPDPHPALRADLPLSGGGGASGTLSPRGPRFVRAARSSLPLKGGGIGWGSMLKLAPMGSSPGVTTMVWRGDMGADLDKDTITKAYARWAPVYDLVFGAVFERGRTAAIAAAERIGGRILEVGVGTGLSLPDYARTNRLVGVDISEPMLRKAQERIAAERLTHVHGLAVMDATQLAFPDATFDVVVAQYVITAVPHPEATLDEFARVLKA